MTKPDTKYVHSVFENIANEYDKMNSIISFGQHKRWRKFTMNKMSVRPGQSAIDVCCGTCDWTISLAQAVGREGYVVGLDFSENMLKIGKAKIEQMGVNSQTDLVDGNAMEIPFSDNTFDYATIGFALRNVPDYRQVLSEMTRVVKPGGLVVSLEASKPPWKWYRQFFYFYFYRILPVIGKLLVNKYNEYNWLPQSLTNFPDSQELAKVFSEVGLTDIQTHLFAGGVAALHIGVKKG
ncbi:demethylmenaquinone methyltransferase [Microaerobacter geothermalis]|uniref:demethylmenaquinone methyltransferase n=1 Tax=Microaerobacter geothermalis TaxID=674972 RepID=UPI001F253A67|nr:demethylmenaquinone methyltransferase [Microaerobacter geothermalis]MCF6095336.1 demethylmenaquinone methyltransferase [Microaerobacter geothermalis]